MEIRGDAPFGPTSQRPPAASWQAEWNVAASQRTRAAPSAETSGDLRGGNSRNVHDFGWPVGTLPSKVPDVPRARVCAGDEVASTFPLPLANMQKLPSGRKALVSHVISVSPLQREAIDFLSDFFFFFSKPFHRRSTFSSKIIFLNSELLSDLHAACAADPKCR